MYVYEEEKRHIFTEEGQKSFLKIRDHVQSCLKMSGAVTMGHAMIGSGDSWVLMACVDRLVELGEMREIPQERCAGQHRVFVPARES